ncbi:DUF3772 domain-containing protein [Pseudomonas sp.]|uniref:DUF3772 domain-containing protein n=1 Tax=Pseudomonas sp. TaxID=306 RepID=UPI003CC5222E
MIGALLIFIYLFASEAAAVEPTTEPANRDKPAWVDVSPADLTVLQLQLDSLKQTISSANNYNQLERPLNQVKSVLEEIARLTAALVPEQAQLQNRLAVLGPVPTGSLTPEKADIAAQRSMLVQQKTAVDDALQALATIKQNATGLQAQITDIRRDLLENELTLATESILSPRFWAPLLAPAQEDRQHLGFFMGQLGEAGATAWLPGYRLATSLLIVLALLVWTLGRYLMERGLTHLCLRYVPEGRLRRSTLALASVAACLVAAACALHLLMYGCTRNATLTPLLSEFCEQFEKVVYACVLITGLGRALLSTSRPSWRLPTMADAMAATLAPFPRLFASALLVLTTVQITNIAGMSSPVVIAGRGIIALVVTGLMLALLVRAAKARRQTAPAKAASTPVSTFTGVLYVAACLVVVASLFALLAGYISFARFITYELVWVFIIFAGFYLLLQLFKDSVESLFSPRHASGKALKQLLGLSDRRLDQACVIVSGGVRAVLYLLAAISLFVGGIGVTLGQLITRIADILGGAGLRKLDIIPSHVLNALLALLIGVFLVRSLRRWLDHELLPKTDMAPGMGASLSTLFGNIGYALVILFSLSSLGVRWTNLAWIVSALSVGIGFGLQEIVKNFVSGLILLTERPVKVGDLISISGVEGDIRRINVRATEIQLSDRSIVIVPNSQLISQNLRNVTLGGSAQGVATLELLLPLNISPDQAQNLLLDTYRSHPAILEKPAPFVRFSKLSPDGITLTVTGYVGSPRIVGTTKSDLLFEILKRLGAAGIELARPSPVT